MVLRISVHMNRAEAPAAAGVEAGTQTELQLPLPQAPVGYEVAEESLPIVLDRRVRVYLVWSAREGLEALVGVHWSYDSIAWHALQALAGWGGLRQWHRTIVGSEEEARQEFAEGCPDSIVLACRVFRWTRAVAN